MVRRKRKFYTFQTFGWEPGTKISYYGEQPHDKVGIQIETKRRKIRRQTNRKNSQRLPHDLYLKRRACLLEGRLLAIRYSADILDISLPNRDDIIV